MKRSSSIAIIKVGSRVLVRPDGNIDYTRIAGIVRDVVALGERDLQVVLVTSGAVAAGNTQGVRLKGVPRLQRPQLFAAVGQPRLLGFYSDMFMQFGIATGQVLVSRDAFASRTQYFSIRDTIRNLVNNDIVPIVNDNDVLHREESDFDDNDHLAAYLGGMLNAQTVFFLTGVRGIYKDYPPAEPDSPIFDVIDGDFSEVEEAVTGVATGRGGMRGKLNAIKLLYELGVSAFVLPGMEERSCARAFGGEGIGTRFAPPHARSLTGVRKWLCTGAVPKGEIVVSRIGAEVMRKSDQRGSLLSRGIVELNGDFSKNDVVGVTDEKGRLLGYGICRFSSVEIPPLQAEDGVVVIHADYFYGTDYGYFD